MPKTAEEWEASALAWQRQLMARTTLCEEFETQLHSSEMHRATLQDKLKALESSSSASAPSPADDSAATFKLKTVQRVLQLDRATLSEMKQEVQTFSTDICVLQERLRRGLEASLLDHAHQLRNTQAKADAAEDRRLREASSQAEAQAKAMDEAEARELRLKVRGGGQTHICCGGVASTPSLPHLVGNG